MLNMRVFVCTNFVGHYPVGVSAVILADDVDQAKRFLLNELELAGLKQDGDDLEFEEIDTEGAYILDDGNY